MRRLATEVTAWTFLAGLCAVCVLAFPAVAPDWAFGLAVALTTAAWVGNQALQGEL